MAKLPINPFLLLRRAVSGHVRTVTKGTVAREEAVAAAAKKKEEMFWVRDPKTGNWIPESHVGDHQIDVAEQREKLLPKKNMF